MKNPCQLLSSDTCSSYDCSCDIERTDGEDKDEDTGENESEDETGV